ncbi:DUF4178 domain-containing protein [Rhodococcus hoagii]|nr:DUF4178 domain-containing protein [Prescottella equi]
MCRRHHTYAGIDHVVRGHIVLDEEGYQWREHLLDVSQPAAAGSPSRTTRGSLEMTLWMRREGPSGTRRRRRPRRPCLPEDRVRLRTLHRRGHHRTAPTGSMDYADYETADKTGMLAFERWPGPRRGRCRPDAPSLAAN